MSEIPNTIGGAPGAGGEPDHRSREQLLAEIESLNARIVELLRQAKAGVREGEAQARLAAIVESSDDAIVSKTLQGIIMTWNKGAERIFGYTAAEVVGKAINIIIPPDRQHEEPKILERLGRGERVDHFETIRMRKDGRLINVSVTISPVRDATGRIIGASKVARDITLQKQFEKELKEAKDAAEAANRAKDHFLSVLSHELRTPLTPVLAAMSYMEAQPGLPEDVRSQVGMVRRNVETEARLVDDLLDLTRIARGKISLHFEAVDVHEVLRAAVKMLQPEIDAKGLEVTIGLRARQHHVWADPGRLQQVFLNLLSNAVKFTPAGGTIAVRTSELEGGRVRVEVSDTGIGIEPEAFPRLFAAFEQAERSRRFGGLGLGLSIAKSLVEMHGGTMHGGTIRATSEGRDRGATFTVELGTTQGPKAGQASAALSAIQPLAYRVLLVEDHTDTRQVLERLLTSFGCVVSSAGSVAEAVRLADQGEYDVLISDIGLPDGSGMQVMEHVRGRRAMKGIALTGYGQDEDLRRSREAGFETHLTKPVNFQVLRETIKKVVS